jgi:hypothetical protein
MPESVAKMNDDLTNDFLYHDSFYEAWDRESAVETSANDAYAAYLMWANPDVGSYEAIQNAVAEANLAPSSAPKGLNGVSRNNFIGDARINGVDHIIRNGRKYFIGLPPKRKEYAMTEEEATELFR